MDMTLTPEGSRTGKRAARRTGKLPTQWRAMKSLLVELALGKTPKRRPRTAANVRAAAWRRSSILPVTSSPADVLDAWAARELGMAGQRLTIASVRAHILATRARGSRKLRESQTHLPLSRARGAWRLREPMPIRCVTQFSRDWLSAAQPKRSPAATDDLQQFASIVKEIARDTTDQGRFDGRFKVLIALDLDAKHGRRPRSHA